MAEALPRISIVTPSYNQAAFLEATLQSVLTQNYPNLEYIVMDGGSTDGSLEILKRYDRQLTTWVSEPDGGQYAAIQKGFSKTTGDIMAWLNSDDQYLPWTLQVVAEIFTQFPQIEWLTTLHHLVTDERGIPVYAQELPGFARRPFFRGENLAVPNQWYATGFIMQEGTFWRRSLWERVGAALDLSLPLAGDFELWARFYQQAELYGVSTPLAQFRSHSQQKSKQKFQQYIDEAKQVLSRYDRQPYTPLESFLHRHLRSHLPLRIAVYLGLTHLRHFCINRANLEGWQIEIRWV